MRGRSILLALALATGCVDQSPHVRVGLAPAYSPRPGASVSVFGVFHDGRMSGDSWKPLAPTISRALGKDACAVGWGDGMREAEPELAQWVDSSTRENGVNEEMLGRIAPRAQGELVMMLMVYRYIPRSRSNPAVAVRRRTQGAPGPRPRVYRRDPRMQSEEDDRVFELSASLYSVRERALVAEVDLRYAGDDLDEAMKAFAAKLRTVVPGASCVGWKWPEPQPSEAE